ncbi:TPA: hypothetical protein SIA28_000344 [Aeromonas salmonicida]|nr:hypothetical protein [Aeromonas salmonicida]HEH9420615.1 hypothetical protein [Aeromonas salmonicida]HEH9433864.1 hypothetical protein [Aeromonas salmonicida]
MKQPEKTAFSLVKRLEVLLIIGEKSALILAAICLWLMSIEFLNGAPLDTVSTLGKAVICAFVIELARVVILFIKWAQRKRQACKGG